MSGRLAIVVLDSAGVGELPDAAAYGDVGSNTLANLARAVGGLDLPVLGSLGLGRIASLPGLPPADSPLAAYGRMATRSAGKDTTTGHWEMMGVVLERPFATFPGGFPAELMDEVERRTGRRFLGNRAASGTEIIRELGGEHLRTGHPIAYTSADSVFQVAAHEQRLPVGELYALCQEIRQVADGWRIGRVIARPFDGEPGRFERTPRRRDFSLPPTGPTVLDRLTAEGIPVTGVGKIGAIFAGRGIGRSVPTISNREGIEATGGLLRSAGPGLLFVNLVDFDMLYGHRNDPTGYHAALVEFDRALPGLLAGLNSGDLLLVTADHGCDPTTPSTDHSREYVPLLVAGPGIRPVDLGTRPTLADVGATAARFFGVGWDGPGESFLEQVAG